jgi:hypothetical protein
MEAWNLSLFMKIVLLGLARKRDWKRRFFTAEMKRFVLNRSESTNGCFTASFFQTQHASFCGRCGGLSAVGGGNRTQKNISACAHTRQNNRTATSLRLPFQASAHMDLDFKIFDSKRLITEVEKGTAPDNNATQEYSDKNCKEKLWIKVCKAVVPN